MTNAVVVLKTVLQVTSLVVATNWAYLGNSTDRAGRTYTIYQAYMSTNEVSVSTHGTQQVEQIWDTWNGPTNGPLHFRPILSCGLFPTNQSNEPLARMLDDIPVRDTADRRIMPPMPQ